MHAGHILSGAGHLGLIGWLMWGGVFAAEPEPVAITEVSLISLADLDALRAAVVPPVPAAPDPVETPAALPSPPPEIADTLPDAAEPIGDLAVLAPEVSADPAPPPIDRVAPQPAALPDPEATPDPDEQEAVAPEPSTAPAQSDPQEATAPEAAVPEIVTEASRAPARSSRPPGQRPAAPEPQVADVPTPVAEAPQAADPVSDDDVLAALRDAQESPAAPSGPPLSSGERDALRVAVAQCWNVGSLSSEAMQTTVVIGVRMTQSGTPVMESIRMLSAAGGSDGAARRVFDSARRAIIRCGSGGFDLPQEKFSQWQNIEMTFDPRKMALR
ncbi:MAG: energy transducer TonB [Pseudomonadota bacterium]